jgi:HEAT repeat protein
VTQLLVIIAPLRLTFWVIGITLAVILILIAIGVTRHVQSVRAARRREVVGAELGPVFSRFLETQDPGNLAEQLRPAILHMDAAQRPAAALLAIELIQQASSPAEREALRDAMEESGIVELGERGTRRRSPWRRALACDTLGKIGCARSVPALLQRLEDRRPEVRMAAVRALGEIGSADAIPALSEAFLERRVAPTDVVNDALRRIGGEAGPTFERGAGSADPIVRVSSCFGLSGIASTHGGAVHRLSRVLGTDPDAGVRAAAAASLGIAGGGKAPAELLGATDDQDVNVRRAAVQALGSFDDPTTADRLLVRAEDDDREVAIRSAEALLELARRPHAAAQAQALLRSSPAWAVEYAQTVAEVSA